MKDMARILTATYGVALAVLMFTYVAYASVKPIVKPAAQPSLSDPLPWAANFYYDGSYEKK